MIENSWISRAQRAVTSSAESSWRPVVCGALQGIVLGPVLFKLVINDHSEMSECALNMVADDMTLVGVTDSPEGSAATQQDLDRLERWVQRKLVKFKKEVQDPKLEEEWPTTPGQVQSSSVEEGMGVLMDKKLL